MSECAVLALLASAGLLSVPVLVLLTQVLAAALPRRLPVTLTGARPAVALLVPAHNEAMGISATMQSIASQLRVGDRLIVVADNCSDDTARIAESACAEVVRRVDQVRKGKGYALDFGVRHIERTPELGVPDILVVVDADCLMSMGAVDQIARLSAATGRPVQATYLMHAPSPAGALTAIAEFAWVVKNKIRPLGARRLGLPCHLMGSGMAFPWPTICATPLASGQIVEDMKLGLDLARAGRPPLFCPEALVWSHFPGSEEGACGQRTRWEHGHLALIIEEVPSLFWGSVRGQGSGLLALALDLCVPPLALLTVIAVVLFAASLVLGMLTGLYTPVVATSAVLAMLVLAVLLSWWHFGRELLPFASLLMAFVYILRKLPLYWKFLIRRQATWVRAKRDGD